MHGPEIRGLHTRMRMPTRSQLYTRNVCVWDGRLLRGAATWTHPTQARDRCTSARELRSSKYARTQRKPEIHDVT